ncbi:hypothetical protein TUM20985_51800 [Mycobacterium antarcticum]|uniref:hypothetical protein n=1 Tax=Mycolicibacterium sp. TUM20985 TaxID=3023370 RepID=UPI0025725E9D|nr:hypothetical protein [Mycolicibacterium sp. TUM20985]BDX34633.1 hypothetical protein TUM20985_51800 [Mycolicibacterium sp. TUM20985]
MSRSNAAKKARRKKRLNARNDSWLPADVHADVQGVARIADEIIPRGWIFDDAHSGEDFVTWYYPPSGVEVDDESVESVTRLWLTDPEEPHVLLVGSAEDPASIGLTVEELFARLDEVESYRIGDPFPVADSEDVISGDRG